MTMGEKLIQRGIQRGILQGEGSLLMYQLEQKFNTIPKSYRQMIVQADSEMIYKWGTRFLKAEALEEVFN